MTRKNDTKNMNFLLKCPKNDTNDTKMTRVSF